MRHSERGVALLEVVVALVILSLAGLALMELVGAHTRAVARAAEREHEQWDEERLLTALALLKVPDLDIRLGTREVGPYVVTVQRPEEHLYRIAIARHAAPAVEDLVTVIYRPGAAP